MGKHKNPRPSLDPVTAREQVEKRGSVRGAAHYLNVDNSTVVRAIQRGVKAGIILPIPTRNDRNRERSAEVEIGKPAKPPRIDGRVSVPPPAERPQPVDEGVRRYILTCAQNNTLVHEPTWTSLSTLAAHYGAELMIARFKYDLVRNGGKQEKDARFDEEFSDELWYDDRILPYLADDRVRLAPGLVWCGNMNLLPTLDRPLSGLESYTARDSGIFPHVKIAMQSIASGKYEATKFNYTTGTVTQRNYIQRKAGQKAEFHHCYGALLVEVDRDGWWCRQLNADSEGVIHDLDIRVDGTTLTTGNSVEGLNLGDLHADEVDDAAFNAAMDMDDKLRPRYIFAHDSLSFRSRNHHDAKNPHMRFELHVRGQESVEKELERTALLLNVLARRDEAKVIVVDSNHDRALGRWLREADYRDDPVNAVFFLRAQLRQYEAIAAGDDSFHLYEWAADEAGVDTVGVKFLREDESFILCHDRSGGVECGMHGHLGPNGSRGGARAFSRMGRKANVGHTHSAGIDDGIYTAGTTSRLNLSYNRGPSSWSHSDIVTYPNGKRTVVTVWKGKWRAGHEDRISVWPYHRPELRRRP